MRGHRVIPRAGTAGAVVAMAAGMLLGADAGQAAAAPAAGTGADDGRGIIPDRPPLLGLLVIDNSHADSWLEVDRTLNTLLGGRGTAGSDHDGGGGANDVITRPLAAPGPLPEPPGHPPHHGTPGED
ncbi:hypothetical protein [Streptomyces sp. NPDC046261]|uniref:hypothetical protein n=1 Tax=Streptomyces sp. NPDC046261 TaxID=3157200 RepID=UPI0033E51513